MSFFSQNVKPVWRAASSLACAVKKKAAVSLGYRRPTRTCQIPGLQQLVDERICPDRPGTFVEVGAYDGERFSNTSWLADSGWRGIYIEPSRQFSRWCRFRHILNNVTVLNVAAGEKNAEATLMQVGSLSTMCEETFDEYGRIEWAKPRLHKDFQRQTTEIRTLDSILETSCVDVGFDILVVDVEGFEENVFSGFDVRRWRPTMMIVELCDAHPDFSENAKLSESASRVRQKILNAGYREVYCDKINSVFELVEAAANHETGERLAVA
ncbi:FkbM family methyltransferase [Candidatus Laterigemmans baculatus]|uniref:FkbM family methyltransferase n=1 Tax=Candidatus Laterigemmans baculatus TaxID=2770505 RepID=UPI0013DA36F0|nr:FkbM family methyltransferase [Candidatus Laterigemmans baculatus]